MDLTYGINPYQPVEGMVADYEKKVAREDAQAHDPDETYVPKEHMEPSRESLEYVRKGRLNPMNGDEIPCTSKSRCTQVKQFGRVSEAYLKGYDNICWS